MVEFVTFFQDKNRTRIYNEIIERTERYLVSALSWGITKFGENIKTERVSDEQFKAIVNVSTSKTFYAWCFRFAGQMKITGAEQVRQEYTFGYEEKNISISDGIYKWISNIGEIEKKQLLIFTVVFLSIKLKTHGRKVKGHVFFCFGAEYRGATFDGDERQSRQQVKGGSHYPVNDACVIKYWVLPDAKKQVGSKLPPLRSKEKSRKRGNEK